MKKETLCFARGSETKFLPQFSGRRFGTTPRQRAYKSEGGEAETAEEKAEKAKLMALIRTQVEGLLNTRAKVEDVATIMGKMTELEDLPVTELRAIAARDAKTQETIVNMGLELTKLKDGIDKKVEKIDVRSQVQKWMETNKAAIESIVGGTRAELPALNIREVASPMTPTTVNPDGSVYIGRVQVESGINPALRDAYTFWDYLKKGRTNASTYVWVNAVIGEGEAEWLAPGELKPGIDFSFEAENSNAKKIADSAKAATELLQDIDGMTSFIENELKAKVFEKVNATLMDSVGSSVAPKGVKQYSVTYTLTTVKTNNANYMDALRAVVAQLRSGKLKGPIDIFINPIDSANIDMAKANSSGVYIIPPFASVDGKNVSGARIIEDSNIPVGTFQAGMFHYYRVLIYKDFAVTWGWENDDFTRNLVTAVGEMRLHQFVNTMNNGAFVRDTFANVIAAIEDPAP